MIWDIFLFYSDTERNWSSMLDGPWVRCPSYLQQKVRCVDVWNTGYILKKCFSFILYRFSLSSQNIWLIARSFLFVEKFMRLLHDVSLIQAKM
jgi:hypothetical protein